MGLYGPGAPPGGCGENHCANAQAQTKDLEWNSPTIESSTSDDERRSRPGAERRQRGRWPADLGIGSLPSLEDFVAAGWSMANLILPLLHGQGHLSGDSCTS